VRVIPHRPVLALAYTGRIAGGRIKEAVAAHGLKPSHSHVLTLLAEQETMSQQALLEELGVDPSMLVSVLNDLEDDGLATRRRDRADRRRHIVEISVRGRQLVARLEESFEIVETELMAALDDEEIATLTRILSRIRDPGDNTECGE
jgi:DNA-binding MarR family transcriptional regulator